MPRQGLPTPRFTIRNLAVIASVIAGLLAWSSLAAAQTCNPAVTNAIVCENLKPGNPSSEWSIDGIGDPSIQGFATDISVNRGESVHFKIDTDAHFYHTPICS